MARRYAMGAGLFAGLIMVPPLAAQTYTVLPSSDPAWATADEQPTKRDGVPRVTLTVQDSTVGYIVRALTRQANYLLFFDEADPRFAKRISVRVVDMNVLEAITVALKGTGLTAKFAADGGTVMIRGQEDTKRPHAVAGTIVGTVTDSATGRSVIRAKISVQETKLSATTGENGQFTLGNVPSGPHVVTVKAFGYKPVTRSVTVPDTGRVTLKIVLTSVPTLLSGVVTTATGQEQRLRVGSDITKLDVDSIRKIAPVTTLTDLLENRVPGLVVTHTSGVPGAPSRLRLRGVGSVTTSNDPILIVDGIRVYSDQSGSGLQSSSGAGFDGSSNFGGAVRSVPGGSSVSRPEASGLRGQAAFAGPSPFDQIDPNTIESVQVMKGPSAAAMYGSDAGNGVIVVTTKRGRPGPTHWNVAYNLGQTRQPMGKWPLNYYRFGQKPGTAGSIQCSKLTNCFEDSVVSYQALDDPRYSPLKTGNKQEGSVTLSGGSGALSYSATGTLGNETGILRLPAIEADRFLLAHGFAAPGWVQHPNYYTTWGGTSRVDWRLGDRGGLLSFSGQVFNSSQQQSSLNAGTVLTVLGSRYLNDVYSADASGNRLLFSDFVGRAQLNTYTTTNSLTLNWPVAPWMQQLQLTGGIQQNMTENNFLIPNGYLVDGGEEAVRTGMYSISRGAVRTPTLTGNTSLHLAHVNTAIGFDVHALSQSTFQAATLGLPLGATEANIFVYPKGGGPTQSGVNQSTFGWFVSPTLDFASRFFASPGLRFDGGSASGSGAQFNPFPRMDLSFIMVDRQDGNPWLGAVTLLRTRLGFGVAGVQPSPGDKLRLFGQGNAVPIGGEQTPTASLVTFGNTELKPERSRELETGFDAELWNQRLSASVSLYWKLRYDAILPIPVAPSAGYSGQYGSGGYISKNIGDIRNTGVNATLSTIVLDNRAVRWNVTGNLTTNQNTVLRLGPGLEGISLNGDAKPEEGVRLRTGFPLNSSFARPITSYADADHDGVIRPDEIRVGDRGVYVGNPEPGYQLNAGTTLGFFNNSLQVNTALSYQSGLTQFNASGANPNFLHYPGLPPAQQAAIVAAIGEVGADPNGLSHLAFYQTVNTLRWSTLSVNVVMPDRLAHLFRASSMMVALQGNNLGLHTNYRGRDPDVNANATGNGRSDTGQLPEPRLFVLRVTLGN